MTEKLSTLATNFNTPGISALFHVFLCREHLVNEDRLNLDDLMEPKVSVVMSATSVYFAPSDCSGITGFKRELMRATPRWRGADPRFDMILVRMELEPGPHGLSVARFHVLFSFVIDSTRHEVALVKWFSYIGDSPDEDTGMWVVKRNNNDDGSPSMGFICINKILRSCHLLPLYGKEMISSEIT